MRIEMTQEIRYTEMEHDDTSIAIITREKKHASKEGTNYLNKRNLVET